MPTNSPLFRHIYANAIAIAFNGPECILTFGIKAEPLAPDEEILQEMAIVLTPTTAKLLSVMLERVLGAAEKSLGQPIPVDESKVKLLEDVISKANEDFARRSAASTSSDPNPTS